MPGRPCAVVLLLCAACGCRGTAPDTALERLTESRRLAADLLVQLTKSADAGNRAVMASSEEMAAAFGREAEQADTAVQRDTEALRPALQELRYSPEERLLADFATRFTEYRTVDRTLLDLTAENTNPRRSGFAGRRVRPPTRSRDARGLDGVARRGGLPGRGCGRPRDCRRA
jgi:hypothetical protein